MQVNIQSSFKVTGNLLQLIEEQIQALTKYYGNITYADVYLRKENKEPIQNSEIKVKLGIPGPDVVVIEKSSSFEKSLKMVSQTLKRKLKNSKK